MSVLLNTAKFIKTSVKPPRLRGVYKRIKKLKRQKAQSYGHESPNEDAKTDARRCCVRKLDEVQFFSIFPGFL